LKHINSDVGLTPEEWAEFLLGMDVYDGFVGDDVITMREKTLGRQREGSFATVVCFAQTRHEHERKNILLTALRGFLMNETPDFSDILKQAGVGGFDHFVEYEVRNQLKLKCRPLDGVNLSWRQTIVLSINVSLVTPL